jgi:hypothetical protein
VTIRELPSVHDNKLIAYEVMCGQRRIVLHTRFDEREPHEHIDVVFEGVEAYHFEGDNFGTILFDVGETPLVELVHEEADRFERGRNFGWPGSWNESADSLLAYLEEQDCRAFVINASYGMGGWVLAKSYRRVEVGPR